MIFNTYLGISDRPLWFLALQMYEHVIQLSISSLENLPGRMDLLTVL